MENMILDGPVLKDGLAMRMVKLPDGGSRCEVWKGSRWVKGGAPFDMLEAPWLKREEFRRLGIPFAAAPEHPGAART